MTLIAPIGLNHAGHLTDLALDRLLYDAPDSPGISALQQHIERCDECRQRVAITRLHDATTNLAVPSGIRFDGHVSELGLNRLLDELETGAAPLRVARAHVARCETCLNRESAISGFDLGHSIAPPNGAARTPITRAGNVVSLSSWREKRRWIAPAAGLLAASIAAFVLAPTFSTNRDASGVDGDPIALRGGPFSAQFFVHNGNEVRQVGDGDAVTAGDRLGFALDVRADRHVMILGVDATGAVYMCHPQDGGGRSVAYRAQPDSIAVNEAVRFDELGDHERLLAIACERPFTRGEAVDKLATIGATLGINDDAPLLLDGCVQREIVLRKQPPREDAADPGAKR